MKSDDPSRLKQKIQKQHNVTASQGFGPGVITGGNFSSMSNILDLDQITRENQKKGHTRNTSHQGY